ncbi:DUF3892 domain-containing protein [Paracoccus saliphilus]|uniref:DUF3892 domain-containing protein n=1 Tax=Paracoccus saliphilus TaxID=405559 RepID=A0AA45W5T8_9RHOB|nr:DUF3892 domain-containing protein [Paracoccus saliphilus]WCR05621.1 DUF3892 domain-containing protein [Paracoccus saliphilus]SIS96409.1 Protein of unknown function [Paracoccus saliphilus]
MTELLQITCINKINRLDPYDSISHVGGRRWIATLEEVIRYIESGRYRFYVDVGGKCVNVVIATSGFGNKFLKTEMDKDLPNYLLSLSECAQSY